VSKYRVWKGTERRIAKRLQGERIGQHGTAIDVDAGWLQAQVKHRQQLPTWLTDALGKARTEAGADRLGIVVLHEHGARSDGDLVVLALGDFQSWFGDVNNG
jgi:hypothetical protein